MDATCLSSLATSLTEKRYMPCQFEVTVVNLMGKKPFNLISQSDECSALHPVILQSKIIGCTASEMQSSGYNFRNTGPRLDRRPIQLIDGHKTSVTLTV